MVKEGNEPIRACNAHDLSAISSRMHDILLPVPEVIVAGTLTLQGPDEWPDESPVIITEKTFGPFIKFRERRNLVSLIVRNVLAGTITDEARVGEFDVERIRFDEASSTLRISGCIPVLLELVVSDLDVTVEIGPASAYTRLRWGWRNR